MTPQRPGRCWAIVGQSPAFWVLPLVPLNLVLALSSRTLGVVAVIVTTCLGFVWAMFGPALMLILSNLGGGSPT